MTSKMFTLRFLTLLIPVAFCLASEVNATDQPPLDSISQNLRSPDVQVRIKAAEQLATLPSTSSADGVLPLLVGALGDSDGTVRSCAAGGLLNIAIYTNPKTAPLQPGETDIRSYPPVQSALLRAMEDSNPRVKQKALGAYLISFPVPDDLQNKLCKAYDSEQINSLYQETILMALTIDGRPTANASAILDKLMQSPESSIRVAKALSASVNPPQSFLPQLVARLESAENANERGAFVRAIEKYGSQAKKFLDRVEAVKAKETDAVVRGEMQGAIQSITTAH